jgi:hypothetical protein
MQGRSIQKAAATRSLLKFRHSADSYSKFGFFQAKYIRALQNPQPMRNTDRMPEAVSLRGQQAELH